MLLRGIAIAALLLAGCGDDDALCAAGDPAGEPEMELLSRDDDGAAPLGDGGVLALTRPPQGGRVVFVGARVRNVELCGAELQAALREPCTGRVVGLERRPVQWALDGEGFAVPRQPLDISDYVNLPACPNAASAEDLDGPGYQLEVRLYEASGRVTERVIGVTATCAGEADAEECRCECDADYALGGDCPADPDGGVPACDAR